MSVTAEHGWTRSAQMNVAVAAASAGADPEVTVVTAVAVVVEEAGTVRLVEGIVDGADVAAVYVLPFLHVCATHSSMCPYV